MPPLLFLAFLDGLFKLRLSDELGSKCSCINLFIMTRAHDVWEKSYLVCLHNMLLFLIWSIVG